MASNLSDVESIFYAAIDLATPEECGAYVESACGGNEALRQRVEKLLQAHFRAGAFLEPPDTTLRPASDRAIQEGPGTVIGSYKLLQQIGEGGMGVVFLAEQSRPVQRKVALKIIKPGMDTRQVIARFAAEQQALALMDHPNIARVFDAGATESGRPYFVMELVKGVPITDYCDQQRLTPQQRLELFIPICHALQHAHQKGIIHRDLKPSNVLVALYDSRPVPKVIDFGVAKATGPKLTERTMFTEIGQVVGTLEYMSPEQAELNQLDVDTRSDIYSLGVLLYELLTGTTPFERKQLKAAAFLEMLRVIREVEPPKPSTRLSTTEGLPSIAANRSLEPKKLSGMLRGDLDWIVMKALEKDRSRRYETANALSRDLQRFLADEPVEASPPSTTQRVKRFVRRNKRTVATATAVLVALIAGVIGTSLGLLQAQRQRAEAVTARNDADRAAQQTQRELAAATLQRGLALCEQGLIARGVLWLDRGLELAHQSGANDVEQDCRWNLAAWASHLHQLQFVLPHPDAVLAVALSADGQIVASGCKDGKLRLWKCATGEPFAESLDHKSAVKVLAFHPHEPLILAGCDDGTVTLWDLQTRTRRGPVLQHDGPISSVAFSPNGESILTGSFDGTARLWKTDTGEMIGRPLNHDSARCPTWTKGVVAAFSPDGRSVVTSGGYSWKVEFWDARTSEYKNRSFDAGSIVFSIAWRPSNNSILLGLMQNRVARQRDAETGKDIGVPLGHLGHVESVAYSADGRTIVTGGADHGVRLWDAATGEPLGAPMLHQETVGSVAVSADGQTIVSGSDDATVRIWKRAQGSLVRTIRTGNWTRAAAFSPDGRAVILGVFSSGAKIWSVPSGEIERPFKSTAPNDEVEGVAFSPDGKTVFTQHSTQPIVRWWNRSTGKLLGSIPPQGDRLREMALSPDGATLFTRTDFNARLWNAATGQPIGPPLQFGSRILGQAFDPDGKTLIISSADKSTRLWSAVSGDPLGPARRHSNEISALAYSPDGRMILAAEGINFAQLFDASNWQPLKAPLEHWGPVRCVGFSPDGHVILTGSTDGTGRLWNAATCRPIGPVLRHSDVINVIACSPDGKTVLTASDDTTAKLWRMPEPLRGSIDEVASSVQLSAGMRFDENDTVSALDFQSWLAVQGKSSGKQDSTPATPIHKPILALNDPSFQQWMRGVAALPAEKQVEAVANKLRELNPNFDGTVTAVEGTGTPKIENGVVIGFGFLTDEVTDISPVRALAGLKKLRCCGSTAAKGALSDLSPLKGMRLIGADCSWSHVSDLSPLKGMSLSGLHCTGTSVSDLSPIRGMPLTGLDCGITEVSDLSPLKGMPLTFLNCGTTRVSDLSPLSGMKLTKLFCDKTMVSDLSPLAGMSLTELYFNDTSVSDASPLKGMPLTLLSCAGTKVSDLSGLGGMRLTTFFCDNTDISDLSPLRGMPLVTIYCDNTQISDLSPLAGMKLNEVSFTPGRIRVGVKILRRMPSIQTLRQSWWDATETPEQFWKKYDAGEFGKPKPRVELALNDPAFQRWMKEVAVLPAEKQVEAVAKKLRELNPDFDGTVAAADATGTPKIENGVVTGFGFLTEDVTDILPVRALAGLKKLRCWGSAAAKGELSDLSPLKGMRLTSVDCSWSHVSDLSPLEGMPLTDLRCLGTSVSDLSAIRGMPLLWLSCGSTELSDLSPLKGMPLTYLNCGTTRVSDLSPLAGMKLTKLYCDNTTVSNLAPLHGMPLTTLDCHNTQESDLSPLQGMPLTKIDFGWTHASDLSPLKGMPLTSLACGDTLVSDLSPLGGMPLTSLHCGGTSVSDLSPIKGMPLSSLELHDTQVSDLSPLQGMNLTEVWLTPKNITKGIDVIRQMKSLNTISVGWGDNKSFPPDVFWKKYDAGDFGKSGSTTATPGR